MDKNNVLNELITRLQDQRVDLVGAMAEMSYNEPSWMDRKNALSFEISNIDVQIGIMLTNLEPTT